MADKSSGGKSRMDIVGRGCRSFFSFAIPFFFAEARRSYSAPTATDSFGSQSRKRMTLSNRKMSPTKKKGQVRPNKTILPSDIAMPRQPPALQRQPSGATEATTTTETTITKRALDALCWVFWALACALVWVVILVLVGYGVYSVGFVVYRAVTSVAVEYHGCIDSLRYRTLHDKCHGIECRTSPHASCASVALMYIIWSTTTWGIYMMLSPLLVPIDIYYVFFA